MQNAQILKYVRPVVPAVERQYALKYRVAGVSCELAFPTDEGRQEKAAELVHSGVAITFVPTVV